MTPLSRTEEMLLLMICRLDTEAYGMQIREEVKKLTGKLYAIGGIYVPLDRLVAKGLVKTLDQPGGTERMGRPRRLFAVTATGLAALRRTREMEKAMWDLPEMAIRKITNE